MSDTPDKGSELSQARSEADTILFALQSAMDNSVWARLLGEEQSAIAAARDYVILAKEGNDLTAIRAGVLALDKATRDLAEMMMEAAVQKAIRDGN